MRVGNHKLPGGGIKPPAANSAADNRALGAFQPRFAAVGSESEGRRLDEAGQNRGGGIEDRPAADIGAAATVKRRLGRRTAAQNAGQPAAVFELFEQSGRQLVNRAFQQDGVVGRALRPARR